MLSKILDFEIPPRVAQAFHIVQVLLWSLMIPVTLLTGLRSSVPFLVFVSILALVFSELAAWQGSLAARIADTRDPYGTEVDDES